MLCQKKEEKKNFEDKEKFLAIKKSFLFRESGLV